MTTVKVLEHEWNLYRTMVMPKTVSAIQASETKKAFYAGAGCLFYAIMRMLDPGQEATEADLQKMSDINQEIDQWLEFQKGKPEGHT